MQWELEKAINGQTDEKYILSLSMQVGIETRKRNKKKGKRKEKK